MALKRVRRQTWKKQQGEVSLGVSQLGKKHGAVDNPLAWPCGDGSFPGMATLLPWV